MRMGMRVEMTVGASLDSSIGFRVGYFGFDSHTSDTRFSDNVVAAA
jgi:hypothetical protein